MTNTITILAISTIILSVTFIPLAEASIGWNGFLREIGFTSSPIYEVSDTVTIDVGSRFSNTVSILCLQGDWLNVGTTEFVANPEVEIRDNVIIPVKEGERLSQIIGIEVSAELQDAQLFDVEVTITILCLSPGTSSPGIDGDVGGLLIHPDTTALFLAYGIANAIWIAPTMAGLAAGIYLTKNKWKR